MANELTFTISNMAFRKGTGNAAINAAIPTQAVSITVSGNNYVRKTQTIATSDTTLALGSVATNGVIFVRNLDTTNFVIAGADGSSYPNKWKAGEAFPIRWNGAAIHFKADTASVAIEYFLVED